MCVISSIPYTNRNYERNTNMKSFMNASAPEATKVKPTVKATECSDCSTTPVRSSGQESGEVPTSTATAPEKQVVVMQGPLGTAITQALQLSESKEAKAANVQVPGPAMEESSMNYIQANGQINNPDEFITRISKATGLVPAIDDKPTAINTLIDCASKVDDIEFIMVNKVDSSPSESRVPQKSMIYPTDTLNPANESLVIDKVQVVVTYRKCSKNS